MTSKNNKVMHYLYSYFNNLITSIGVNKRQNRINSQYLTHISML